MFIHFFFFIYKKWFYPNFFLIGFKPFLFNFNFSFLFKSLKSLYIFRKVFTRIKYKFVKIYNFKKLKNSFNPSFFSYSFDYLKTPTIETYYLKLYKKYIKKLNLYIWRVKHWTKKKVIKPKNLYKPFIFKKLIPENYYFFDFKKELISYVNFKFFKFQTFFFYKFKKINKILNKKLHKKFNWLLTNSLTQKWYGFRNIFNNFSFFKTINQDKKNLIFKLRLKLSVFPFFFKIHKLLLKKYSKNFFNFKKKNYNKTFKRILSSFSFFKYQPYMFNFLLRKYNFYLKNPKRIKLRVNYQVIWRKQRHLLKQVLNFKNIYQKSFTRYLLNYNNISLKNFLFKLEFTLKNILLRVKFFFFKTINFFFLENGFIYLNSIVCCNPSVLIFKNDFIQFIVSWRFFFFFKSQLNSFMLIKSKFRYKKWMYLNKNFGKKGKIRKYTLPNWILKFSYFFEDIPLFYELDYQIFTFTLLFIPTTFRYFHFSHLNFIALNSIKLYNWKYLT